MTLIEGCGQHREGDGSFFRLPHFVTVLKGKIVEKLCHWFVEILKMNETCIHPIVITKNFDISRKLSLNICMKNLDNRKYFIYRNKFM